MLGGRGGRGVAFGAKHDHAQVRRAAEQLGQQVHAILIVQPQIQQRGVKMRGRELPEGGGAVFRVGSLMAHHLQGDRRELPDVRFIINDQHAHKVNF